MSRRKRWNSAIRNDIAYRHYYFYFKQLAISRFKWKNLPGTVDERFLELVLFDKGYGAFFKDEILGHLFLTCTIGGELDIYRIPIDRVAWAVNGYNRNLTAADSVIIFDNFLHMTMQPSVDMFAMKLYNIDRTIDVNLNAQKTPILIKCDEAQKLSMENVYKQYDGNAPVIFAYDSMNEDDIAVLKTDAPYLADKLLADKSKIWNEAMTFLGLNNANTEKKERMVTDEVNSNNAQITNSALIGLSARKQACDEINALFGLDIDVELRNLQQTGIFGVEEVENVEEEEISEEGDE